MLRPFVQVDVFTAVPMFGNPLAVVLDANGMDPAAMQRFARWTNLSETTFVLQPDAPGASYQVRIYTPMAELSFADVYSADFFELWSKFAATRTPTIAAVAGYALGGGCELAMMCDILIAADSAKFGQPEIKLGVLPGMGGSQRLTRAIGKAKAMDLILTGRTIDAVEAERAGLVSRLVPADSLIDEALAVAATIAGMSLSASRMAKEAVNRAFEVSLAEGLLYERRLFHSAFATADQKEGIAAFSEKRAANFTHR